MSRNGYIAGIPYQDYLKLYLIISKGFPQVVKKKRDNSTIHPKKFCHIPFKELESIYDCIKSNLPHLFDSTGNIIRKRNNRRENNGTSKIEVTPINGSPLIVTFD